MKNVLVCIDLGGTAMKAGVFRKDEGLSEKCVLPVHQDFEELSGEIMGFVDRMKEKYTVCGVAFSAPGAVDVHTGIIGGKSALPCIHGPAWIEMFSERTGVPAAIENDANCAALAEAAYGNAKEYRDVAFVVCGTGIGGAVVIDKKIHYGANLYGGEFGCMVMRDENGNLSTFSAQASTMSFVRKLQEKYPEKEWNGKKVFEEAEKGNKECVWFIDRFYHNLAEGIYNIQHVYDPEIILLGGGISSREEFIPRLEEELGEIVRQVEAAVGTRVVTPHINVCAFRNDANLIGAAANWTQRIGKAI